MTTAVFPPHQNPAKRVGRVIEIEEYTRRLKEVWLATPELRLGQMIENTFCIVDPASGAHKMNLYPLSDERMLKMIEEKNDGTGRER